MSLYTAAMLIYDVHGTRMRRRSGGTTPTKPTRASPTLCTSNPRSPPPPPLPEAGSNSSRLSLAIFACIHMHSCAQQECFCTRHLQTSAVREAQANALFPGSSPSINLNVKMSPCSFASWPSARAPDRFRLLDHLVAWTQHAAGVGSRTSASISAILVLMASAMSAALRLACSQNNSGVGECYRTGKHTRAIQNTSNGSWSLLETAEIHTLEAHAQNSVLWSTGVL